MPRRPLLLALALLAILVAVYLFGIRWRPEATVRRNHTAFIGAIEDKKWGKCRGLIAEQYGDKWGFNRADVTLAIEDVASQFILVLDFEWTTTRLTPGDDGKTYTLVGKGKMSGKGTPLAAMIVNQSAAYAAEPFTFVWKKQSSMPWDWKLQKIEHPTLDVPSGYHPGDIGRATLSF
jgi:hypothetical protein